MDRSADKMEGQPANQPKHQQDDCDCPQHPHVSLSEKICAINSLSEKHCDSDWQPRNFGHRIADFAMPFSLFLALRYLKPKRTFLSIITLISVIGVMLGVTVLIFLILVMTGFDRGLQS